MAGLILTRGLPGSGKTTFAREWVNEDPDNRARVNRDDLRFATYGKYVIGHKLEDNITYAQQAQVKSLLSNAISVIVDDTNLRAATVRDWYRVADSVGATVAFTDFEIDVDECIRRDVLRAEAGGRAVGEDVIRSFAARYTRKGKLPPVPERLPKNTLDIVPYANDNEALPGIVLCDLDGTIAKNNSGRGFYDWTRVGEDDLVRAVQEAVWGLYAQGYQIIFMSGRDAVCRQQTYDWLVTHRMVFTDLFMRPEGDMRPDDVVKLELFNKHIRDKYRVGAVFDDRLSVSRLWHALGLPLFRVGDPDADF